MIEIPKSISSYEDECAAILSWLSADKWLDQHEFDNLSFAFNCPSRPKRVALITPETIMQVAQGDFNIQILQELCRAGIAEARKNDAGDIEYRLARGDFELKDAS